MPLQVMLENGDVREMTEGARRTLTQNIDDQAAQGRRILAFAHKVICSALTTVIPTSPLAGQNMLVMTLSLTREVSSSAGACWKAWLCSSILKAVDVSQQPG